MPAFAAHKSAKKFVVSLNQATPVVAFAGLVSDKIGDRDGRIRCLRETFPNLGEQGASSLLKSLRGYHAKYRALGSGDKPRLLRVEDAPRASAPRRKQPANDPMDSRQQEREKKAVAVHVASECKAVCQTIINALAAAKR